MRPFDDPADILRRTRAVDRLLTYVRYDTQSDETSETCPSTAKQLELGRQLVTELTELGLRGVGEDAQPGAPEPTAECPELLARELVESTKHAGS